jgi:cold shock CspA family protein
MTGTITELHAMRGTGFVEGDDGKTYLFRRHDLRDCWFHELTVGTKVTFVPGTGMRSLDAAELRPQRHADA